MSMSKEETDLISEVDDLKEQLTASVADRDRLQRCFNNEAKERLNAELDKKALVEYTHHHGDCSVIEYPNVAAACTCGLSKLIEGATP